METKRIFMVVGEKSGDVHASKLVSAFLELDSKLEIQAWGGENMQKAGAKILKNYQDLAFMGFWEVVKNLGQINRNFKLIKKQIVDFNPDQIVLVDYAGFNLRLAKWASSRRFKINYYIAPKTWAWNESRNVTLKKYVDRLFVIFPFEKTYFQKFGINTFFEGNPLVEDLEEGEELQPQSPYIALLPGSRKQEIVKILPLMNELAVRYKGEYRFLIAGISDFEQQFYKNIAPDIELRIDQTRSILKNAKMAIVGSGTATLETALYNVPQIVVYKTSALTYAIAKRFIKTQFISLVNIIANKQVIPELIQKDYNINELSLNFEKLLKDTKFGENQLVEYADIRQQMGGKGASLKIAKIILEK